MVRPGRCLVAGLLLPSCLSPGAPAPAVRWFDPTPAASSGPGVDVRVAAAAWVRSEFVVRVGERELAIDELHRWMAPPEQLVEQVLRGGVATPGRGDRVVDVLVTRFELDLTGAPCARVGLLVGSSSGPQPIDVTAAAAGTRPEQFAAAMAEALAQAAAALSTIATPAAR